MSRGSQRVLKTIPLNPPFSKGEISYPPLEKGGKGGFERLFSDERKGNPSGTYYPSQDEADPSAGVDSLDIHQDRRTYKCRRVISEGCQTRSLNRTCHCLPHAHTLMPVWYCKTAGIWRRPHPVRNSTGVYTPRSPHLHKM